MCSRAWEEGRVQGLERGRGAATKARLVKQARKGAVALG